MGGEERERYRDAIYYLSSQYHSVVSRVTFRSLSLPLGIFCETCSQCPSLHFVVHASPLEAKHNPFGFQIPLPGNLCTHHCLLQRLPSSLPMEILSILEIPLTLLQGILPNPPHPPHCPSLGGTKVSLFFPEY